MGIKLSIKTMMMKQNLLFAGALACLTSCVNGAQDFNITLTRKSPHVDEEDLRKRVFWTKLDTTDPQLRTVFRLRDSVGGVATDKTVNLETLVKVEGDCHTIPMGTLPCIIPANMARFWKSHDVKKKFAEIVRDALTKRSNALDGWRKQTVDAFRAFLFVDGTGPDSFDRINKYILLTTPLVIGAEPKQVLQEHFIRETRPIGRKAMPPRRPSHLCLCAHSFDETKNAWGKRNPRQTCRKCRGPPPPPPTRSA